MNPFKSASPESQDLDLPKLEAHWTTLETQGTKTFLIVRNDCIVFEKYAEDWDPDKKHYTASLVKALVGGTSLMLAIDDGRISPDDPACRYIPQWENDPQKSQITIRHLATHTSGVENAVPQEEGGWKQAFWERQEPPNDPFTLSRDSAPIIFSPGTDYSYSNTGMALLAYAVTRCLQDTPHRDIRTLLQERIMAPIGLPADAWSIGYGQTVAVDDLPLVSNWGGGSFTARAVASLGRLILQRGNRNSSQMIRPETVTLATSNAATTATSGLCWWVNAHTSGGKVWPSLPEDACVGLGAEHQVLLLIPSLNLICVRNGALLGDDVFDWTNAETYLFAPLMEAVNP